jgi:hypothetical protein
MRILKLLGLTDFSTALCALLWLIGYAFNIEFILSFAYGWSIGYIFDVLFLRQFLDKIIK